MELLNFLEKNLKKPELIDMKFQLRKCEKCNSYSLKHQCIKCNLDTFSAHPAKFSPDDKYLKYRLAGKFSKK